MIFDTFKSNWLGKICDYDKVYRYQCVDIILQGLYEVDGLGSGVWGNAIDYWNKPTTALLRTRYKVHGSDAIKGDAVILKTRGFTGDPGQDPGDGHIGWSTGNINASQVEILEQNGATGNGSGEGNDAIRTRWIDRSRVAGLLRRREPDVILAGAPASPSVGTQVHLPASVATWAVYHRNTFLRKGTSDQAGTLLPSKYGGLTYSVEGWIGDYGVNITTKDFGAVAIYVKNTSAQFSTPTPPAAVLPPEPLPYGISPTVPPIKRIVRPGHKKWDLSRRTFEDINNNPLEDSGEGKVIEVTATLVHKELPQYLYYLEDPNVPQGWNAIDTDEYVPPPPPKVPDAPLPIPLAEPITLVVKVNGYENITDAMFIQNPIGDFEAGDYRIIAREKGMLRIAKRAVDSGVWINPVQNTKTPPVIPEPEDDDPEPITLPEPPAAPVPAVKPPDWQKVALFFPNGRPVKYKARAQSGFRVNDLATGKTLGLFNPNMPLHLIGTFEKDGRLYGMTQAAARMGIWPGIPMGMVKVDFWANFLEEVKRKADQLIDSK